MLTTIFLALFVFALNQDSKQVSTEQKEEFIAVMKTLPTKGEFYTDEAVKRVVVYLPVLFALSEEDILEYDIYPFLALSRGLYEYRECRMYSVHNFAKIRHGELKLFWGALLFGSGEATLEIERFLQNALRSEEQTKLLSEMMGPKFEAFRRRVLLKKLAPY